MGYIQSKKLNETNDRTLEIYEEVAGLKSSSFNANYTYINGGAIYNQGQMVIAQNTFEGNYANINGGAIYNVGNNKLFVSIKDTYL